MIINNVMEQLGHPPDAKLLIIHADDFGMCHSVNLATIAAFEMGAISSASVMVPCPWFLEAATYSQRNPEHDIGVHLTLTSEWKDYKWAPVSTQHDYNGLVDSKGYFWPSASFTANRLQVEHEICAQLTLASAAGIVPSHIDNHMFSLASPGLVGAYVALGRRFKLP